MKIEIGEKISLIVDGKPSRSKKLQGVVVDSNYFNSLVRFDFDNGAEEWIDNERLFVKKETRR